MSRLAGALVATGLAVLASAASMTAAAQERSVELVVDNMWCAACPYIVQTVLKQIPGVKEAVVRYPERTATVVFDDEQTSIEDLTRATGEFGYPSRPKG